MRVIAALLATLWLHGAAAQPADCPSEPTAGPTMPLALDLPRLPGAPSGVTGQMLLNVPLTAPGIACREVMRPPSDVLRGEPGELLRGPGTPHVTVEVQ